MIELKRKELELARVELARQELELKIEERSDEIKRLQSMIEIQKNKEIELKAELVSLRNKGE